MMRLIKDQATCEQLDDGKCLQAIDPLDGTILIRGYPVCRRQSSGFGRCQMWDERVNLRDGAGLRREIRSPRRAGLSR